MEINTTPEPLLETLSLHKTDPDPAPDIITVPVPGPTIDATFSTTTNLTTSVLNASIVSFSDEYFAAAANLLTPTPPIRKAGVYVHTGAWFDGWETRRHNRQAYDWVVIKLGVVGVVEGVEVDTAYFNGNEAPAAALEGCYLNQGDDHTSGVDKDGYGGWHTILPRQECGPSQRQAWTVRGQGVEGKQWTHLRLKMFPDGGIARLRVYGRVVSPPLPPSSSGIGAQRPLEDLASALNGGVAVACSDQHFGVKSNLLLPGRGKDMGDGWETARSRTPGHVDWVIVRLGLRGRSIEKIIVDTKDFRGNFPRAVKLHGWKVDSAKAALGTEDEPQADSDGWTPLVDGEHECAADTMHVFAEAKMLSTSPLEGQVWTHVKMTIIPDGGVKRFQVFGRRA